MNDSINMCPIQMEYFEDGEAEDTKNVEEDNKKIKEEDTTKIEEEDDAAVLKKKEEEEEIKAHKAGMEGVMWILIIVGGIFGLIILGSIFSFLLTSGKKKFSNYRTRNEKFSFTNTSPMVTV